MRTISAVILSLFMVFSGILIFPPGEHTTVVTAQPVPEYQDASNGLPTYSLWVSKTEFFDLDEDGTGDVMVLGPRKGGGDRSLHVFKWDGNSWSNRSDEEGTDTIPHSSYGGYDFGDLDNDGDWDVGIGSHGAARVDAYLRSVGTNWIRSSQGLQASEDAWSVNVGDFNSDGNLDLLVAGFWERQLRVFAGDGIGNWVDQSNGLLKASSRSEAVFCDINNDGNLDIVSTLGHDLDTGEVIWVYKGDGQGNWVNSSQGLPGSGNGEACAFGDFNNDGNVDIALTFWDNTVETYLGDGTGNWTESSVGLVDLSYVSLELVDLNGDKLDDLVAVENSDPGRVHIFLRNENNAWTKLTQNLQGNAKGYRLDVEDFDHNGHPDIVAGFGSDNDMDFPGSVKVWKEGSAPTDLDVTLTCPDGGEYLKTGSIRFIRWISAVPSTTGTRSVKLELSTSGSSGPWTLIEDSLPDTGIYQWAVPDEESGDCYIRITVSDNLGNSASDTSDNAFGIDQQAGGGGGDREPHDPIVIQSDAEWTSENGVRSGSGTEVDPYIIERWDIIGGESNCIQIRNTRAYAIIRDNYLHHATGLAKALVMTYAENLTVSENDITEVHHGINMGDSEVLIENNHLYNVHARGIMVHKEKSTLIARGNLLENTGHWGFKLSSIGGMMDPGKWYYPAIIENNTIIGATQGISLTAAQGNFSGNLIKNCDVGIEATMGTYSDPMDCTFEDNIIISNRVGMDIGLKSETYGDGMSSVIIRGNLIENNVFAGLWIRIDADYLVEGNTIALNTIGIETHAGGNQTIRDNTIRFNLGGIFFHYVQEHNMHGDPVRQTIDNNDIYDNAYYALRNDDVRAPESVKGNYYGGVPGDDGDLLEGPIGNEYRNSPNDPDTPAVRADVTVIDDGDEVTISGITTLNTHYFIRKGGRLEISSGARVDLNGRRVAAKRGAELEVISADISNGLTLSIASDDATIRDTTFRNMVAGVSVYMASPLIEDITVRDQNGSYMYDSTTSRPKYILEPSGIYLYRDTARIDGGNLLTDGYYGVFAMKSEASIQDLSITGKLWGVAVVDGAPRLEGCSISSSEQVGITTSDGSWPYGNVSLTVENCDLQNNPTGIEIQYGDIDSKGTPHNIRIANSTINGGTLALDAEIRDSIIEGNEFTNNGVFLDGTRVKLLGNTISGGSGLRLIGESLRLENNTFEDNQNGTVVLDCSPIFVNNDFIRNQYGVYTDTRGQPKLKYNNFEDNSEYGVYNEDSSTLVNATLNWWNAANGPDGEGSGDGDSVSKYVLFDPWLEEQGDHMGHYENLAPEVPTLEMPMEALLAFDAQGRANDREGDIIRRVELRIENLGRDSGDHDPDGQDSDDYDSGWFSSNAIWRDVNVWGGYTHIFDTLELDGEYTVSARAFDGNDYSEIILGEITVNHPELEAHDPIVITGNSGFTQANGVRSGSGSEGDPFIIERWEITTEDADGISISDTTAHVIVRLCHVYWPEERDPGSDGIVLSNAVNVRVADCRFQGNHYQMNVIQSSQAEVRNCLFLDAGSMEIWSRQSYLELTGSWFHGEKFALYMIGGNDENGLVEDNIIIFKGTNNGGMFLDSIAIRVSGNILMNGTITGGTTGSDDFDFQIHENVMTGGSAGIWFNGCSPDISRNLIVDHTGWGVYGSRSSMTLRNNNLFGNRDWGVYNKDDSAIIDAKYNWWGAANGPGGEGNGDGDAVSEYVEFDPWLDEPYVGRENHAPTLEVIEPDGDGDEADKTYAISWNADDVDGDTVTVDLFYDTDTDPDNGKTLIASDLENTGSYDWDTSEVEEGEYYIYGKVNDNNGSQAATYSPGTLHILHGGEPVNNPPVIEIIEPDGSDDDADESYTITWDAEDQDGDTITIDLYYDADVDPDNGKTLIASDLDNTGSFEWDTSGVEEGNYYIHGVADDNNGSKTTDHSEGKVSITHESPPPPANNAPQIAITEPHGNDDEADETFTIQWTAWDEDGDTITVDLYFDKDTDPDNGKTQITSDLSNTGSYDWDTSDVEEGDYYIYAMANDNNGSKVADYSDGKVSITHTTPPPPENHPPKITIFIQKTDDYTYLITWVALDTDGDTLKIDLFYDSDTNPDNGKTLIAKDLSNIDLYNWDISGLDDGNYYILAAAKDGKGGDTGDYSGRFTIALPELLPDFAVISLEIQPSVPGDGTTVTLRSVVENHGNATGSGEVEFLLAGIVLDSRSLTLKPGKEGTVTFIWTAMEGNHSIMVRANVADDPDAGNNELVKTVSVTGTPRVEEESDDEFPVFWSGLMILVMIVVIGSVIVLRRRQEGEQEWGPGGVGSEGELCPGCGSATTYSEEEDDHYCWECEGYVGEMENEGGEGKENEDRRGREQRRGERSRGGELGKDKHQGVAGNEANKTRIASGPAKTATNAPSKHEAAVARPVRARCPKCAVMFTVKDPTRPITVSCPGCRTPLRLKE